MAAECEVRLDAQLERGEPCSVKAVNLRLRGRIVGEIRKRLPAPQGEGLGQQTARPSGVRSFRLGDQLLEAQQVDLIRVDSDQVARFLGDDHRAVAEQLSQLRDMELKRVRRVARRSGGP